MLASDESSEATEHAIRTIEYDLNLISAQEQLSGAILESNGLDGGQNKRPLNARELIELYIGEGNSESDHIDFKKALDLVEYIAPIGTGGGSTDFEAEKEATRLRIWARSLMKDAWEELSTDEPIDTIKETTFFKLVQFCYLQGLDLKENMPAPDRLLEAEELGDLKSNANVQYLLRTGYEHVRRHCTSTQESMLS